MPATHQVAVPPQDRVRGDDQVQPPQRGPGEPVQERGKKSTVRRGDPGSVDLPPQNGQLIAQRQDLDVLVHSAHRQQPHEGEHARHGKIGQSQQHDPTE